MDYILNGQGYGSVASRLMQANMDPGVLRPFLDEEDGQNYITVNGQALVTNAPAPFTKDAWTQLDKEVMEAARPRLRLVGDLRGRGLQTVIPNGMSKTSFEFQDESDISDAEINMDAIVRTQQDRPLYNLKNIPLPVIHKDARFSLRQVVASRNGNSAALDVSSLRLAAKKVAEKVEQLAIGIGTPYQVGGGTLYGIRTFPQRLTKTITDPTGVWTPQATLDEILDMKDQSQAAYHYGPWKVYCSTAWDQYLDSDWSASKGDKTLRQRILDVDGIEGVQTLDYLPSYDLLLVSMDDMVMRMVVGMDMTTMQWEESGGLELVMKVMSIVVPNPRADYYDRTGIVHGSI